MEVPLEMPIDYVVNKQNGTAKPVYEGANSRVRAYFKKIKTPDLQKMLVTGKEEFKEAILLVKIKRGSTNKPTKIATEADKRIYKKEWQAFLNNEQGGSESRLQDLYGIRPNDIAALYEYDITTIDELADADPNLINNIPGGPELHQFAVIWRQTRAKEEENKNAIVLVEGYRKRNEELEAELAELRAQQKPERSRRKNEQDASEVS